ncbi:hypothetical protein [Nesterenkonia sp. Act20]|uniref:hypothetical protein n=1 Tax=Nesterenkonia sp. Act20 TaxID=1483432 RepID=UPI001C437210|nr:hypothetical protein [Nesterenkonia sp. Act20]
MSTEESAEATPEQPEATDAEPSAESTPEQHPESAGELSLDELETEVHRADALVQKLSQRLNQTSDDRS